MQKIETTKDAMQELVEETERLGLYDAPKTTRAGQYVERYKQDFPYGNLIQLQKLFSEAIQEAYDDGYEDGASMNPRKS